MARGDPKAQPPAGDDHTVGRPTRQRPKQADQSRGGTRAGHRQERARHSRRQLRVSLPGTSGKMAETAEMGPADHGRVTPAKEPVGADQPLGLAGGRPLRPQARPHRHPHAPQPHGHIRPVPGRRQDGLRSFLPRIQKPVRRVRDRRGESRQEQIRHGQPQ